MFRYPTRTGRCSLVSTSRTGSTMQIGRASCRGKSGDHCVTGVQTCALPILPGFMQWLKQAGDVPVSDEDRALLARLDEPDWFDNAELAPQLRAVVEPLAAHYFLKARTSKGRLIDSVARFHLGNGARLERIDWLGDLSLKGLRESAGIMVNYLYRLEDIEKNHEAYANQGEIAASSAVKKLLKTEGRRLLDMRLS